MVALLENEFKKTHRRFVGYVLCVVCDIQNLLRTVPSARCTNRLFDIVGFDNGNDVIGGCIHHRHNRFILCIEKKKIKGLTFSCAEYKLCTHKSLGWLAERSNATVLKTADGATRPGVRIPHHPPQKQNTHTGVLFLSRMVRDKETRTGVRQAVDFTNKVQ